MGFALVAGLEVEYFLSRSAERFEPLDRGGYFDLTTADASDDVRKRATTALDQLGVHVEALHHEDAPGQHEVDLSPADALDVADGLMTSSPSATFAARLTSSSCAFGVAPPARASASATRAPSARR